MTEWPNLRDLEVFLAVVDRASIGAAARNLGISQPQASRIVANLEAQMRGPLLRRSARGSVPTSLGAQFAEESRKLLSLARDHLEWQHMRAGETVPVTLRLAASMTIAETLIPRWLSLLRRTHPLLVVDLRVLNSEQVIDSITESEVEIGFVETPTVPNSVSSRQVGEDRLAVVVSPEHPWAGRAEPVTAVELAATPLVVRESGSGTRSALEEHLHDFQVAKPLQVLHSNMAVRIAAAAGAAPAVLSHLAVADQVLRGELIQVPLEEQIVRPLTALWPRGTTLPQPAKELLKVISKVPFPG